MATSELPSCRRPPAPGNMARLHQLPVERAADGFGLPAMRCAICHLQANFNPAGVPGNPIWHLAPRKARHTRAASLSWTPEHPAHGPLYRASAGPVQAFLD
jgi:hypothetical protein